MDTLLYACGTRATRLHMMLILFIYIYRWFFILNLPVATVSTSILRSGADEDDVVAVVVA